VTAARPRLDVWLVERGLAPSREKAQALIMAGRVRVDGLPGVKPGSAVRADSQVEVLPGPEHVGRGAIKLAGALDRLGLDPGGQVTIDVGSSTGGFTEALLARGALRVHCVDVGRAQLHERLRQDPRVRVLEATNARSLSPNDIGEECAFATMDVSFISVLKILPALRAVLTPDAVLAVLVKPQFEVGRADVGRGGIVRDAALHRRALESVARGAQALGYGLRGACASPIDGAEGNREFFLALSRDATELAPEGFDAMISAALEP
jgi:23S rRNA (cytidine1920-2'-O)/16S rRNA (cytidine1409-2'-O)-methyltransferase